MPNKAAKPQTRRVFNLLKPYKPPLTGWDRIYDWLVGQARVIMIVAEVVVAVTFGIKVVIDTQAKALEDEIARKDYELKQFQQIVEPTLISLQNRAKMYKQLWNNANKYSNLFNEVDGYIINPGADLVIIFSDDEVSIIGEESFDNIAQIENAMKLSSSFNKTSVAQLDADVTGGSVGDYQLVADIIQVNGRTKLN